MVIRVLEAIILEEQLKTLDCFAWKPEDLLWKG